VDENTSYDEFVKKIQTKFDGARLKLKFKDEDGDFVQITDEDDLQLALSSSAGKMEVWCE